MLRRNKALSVVSMGRMIMNWATVAPESISGSRPVTVSNYVSGEWRSSQKYIELPDPLKKDEIIIRCPDPSPSEITEFVQNMKAVPKTGLHNPFKNPDRYLLYGEITARLAAELRKQETEAFFVRLIQRVAPKSYAQAVGEVKITLQFLQNFCGDQLVDLLSREIDWVKRVLDIEIAVLQLLGALYMGNRPLLHVDHRVSVVMEQFLRLMLHCGMPPKDVDFLNGPGSIMNHVLMEGEPRNTLFTGSKRIAEKLSRDLNGKVFLEDAGFDWKILGPDVRSMKYVAWVCDQDAYACSGQKCSAQSLLFAHRHWMEAGLEEALKERAAKRALDDLSVGPCLTWTTKAMLDHVHQLLAIPGARLAFGGKKLEGHTIPDRYGAIEPTAVYVPLEAFERSDNFALLTTEVFGPVQVLTEYGDNDVPTVLEICNRLDAYLTAAVVSSDNAFVDRIVGSTINGTTYVGIRARTTGAPPNHWFGPAGDPRSAGIGSPEAIRLVWSCHREIIWDDGEATGSEKELPLS